MNDLRKNICLDYDGSFKILELIGKALSDVKEVQTRCPRSLSGQNRLMMEYLKAKSRLDGIKDTLSVFYGEEKVRELFNLYG